MKYQVISYCNNKYPDSYGGVARYDYCLSEVFLKEKFLRVLMNYYFFWSI